MKFFTQPDITIGLQRGLFRDKPFGVGKGEILKHMLVSGKTGMGKSSYLAHLYCELRRAGYGVTLIDPHGELAKLAARLTGDVCLNVDEAYDAGQYLALDVLSRPDHPHRIALEVRDAFHRAWPDLADGKARRFDKFIYNGVRLLIAGKGKLADLEKVFTDAEFRAGLMAQESDPDVREFWEWFDKLGKRLQLEYSDSTASCINHLKDSPILKNALRAPHMGIDVGQVVARSQGLIFNLDIPGEEETTKLIGSLLTVMYEQAAKRRGVGGPPHLLMIDEFAKFASKSEATLTDILSECRKYGLFLILGHQNWSQATERLRGALGNVQIGISFRLPREDAIQEATFLGDITLDEVKHAVEEGEERSHPLYYTTHEQWEKLVRQIRNLPKRQFLCRIEGDTVGQIQEFRTPTIKDVSGDLATLTGDSKAFFYTPAQKTVIPEASPAIPRRQKL